MTANAPEKLYIALDELTEDERTFVLDHDVDYPICTEYIRTDAFIEKACEYLRCLRHYNEGFIYPSHTKAIDNFVEGFKKYMER